MTTFLDITYELLIVPDDSAISTDDRIGVGFQYAGTWSVVYLSRGRHPGAAYNPATDRAISTHAMECGGNFVVHMHTEDRAAIGHAHAALASWYAAERERGQMPDVVAFELEEHLDVLAHWAAGGKWEVVIPRIGAPTLQVGDFSTPAAAWTAAESGRVWDLAGIDPKEWDLDLNDLYVHSTPLADLHPIAQLPD
ncbi:hypothetical protein IU459_32660 [Nocardia amamiensis]|uniref:Uncharacterized protein n=1 Tax=Nocardia amamiensis TaxID=404578 RepID=A0ABS0D089_9NOCA|nr:hypothetical protein [Nocardia amamiensis]MBF6302257.1 hypothetical protein [Nocardia amamiensis]